MTVSELRHACGTACAVLLVFCVACERRPQGIETQVRKRASPDAIVDSTCVVASGTDFTIAMSDVEVLRRSYVPSLEREAATRLAVDVWLAEWIATGEIGRVSLPEKLAHHQHLSARYRADWSAKLEEAHQALKVVHGPCYVRRAPTR